MNFKLHIRNLSPSITENDLRTLFARCGRVVLVDIIKDRVTGRSRGYGFIKMSDLLEAEKAIEVMNGHRLDDNEIRVSFVQRREATSVASNNQTRPLPKRGRKKQREGQNM
jgi:splicing factor 1